MEALYRFVNGMTREQLATHLHRKESSICARVDEIAPYLKMEGRRINPKSKMPATILKLNYRGIQIMQTRLNKKVAA